MDIAQKKRKENIAEYILYLWQLEDLLRAMQFSPEAVYSQLVAPRNCDNDTARTLLAWYMDLAGLLQKEGKQQRGHLDHTLHLIADLNEFHLQLLKLPVGANYRSLFQTLEPELPTLRSKLEEPGISDIELCFRTLYGAILYKIKGGVDSGIYQNVVSMISPVIAELASVYRKAEAGEIDLYAAGPETPGDTDPE